ncbi:hypothetical protein L7F22_021161 [Adiantum nelumboides]|nr:hypothetical protein [Adiantum nelumboides]
MFARAWITNTFEVDVMIAWNQLSAINCESLEEYNAKFWVALLPASSFKMVPLAEQIEKYCCGLPKGIKKYCTKTSVMNMAQLMENAKVADDLIQGKLGEDGFKTRRKEPQGKQFSANFKAGKTIDERKALRDAKKCYICEEERHFANECLQRNSQNKDDMFDHKGKKPKPSVGFVPDLVDDQQNVDAMELYRAWGNYVGGRNVDNKLSRVELKWKLMKFYTLTLADAQPPAVTVNPTKDSELIVFGGEHYNGNKTFVYNDLYRYNAEKDQWKHVSSPNSPPPRSAHQAVGWKNSVFVFGGEFTSPNQERFHHYKDLWRLDLATNTWEQLLLKGCPSPRSGHRMVLYKHKIILFGGFYDTLREVSGTASISGLPSLFLVADQHVDIPGWGFTATDADSAGTDFLTLSKVLQRQLDTKYLRVSNKSFNMDILGNVTILSNQLFIGIISNKSSNKGSSAISRWAYIVAHISDPSQVLRRECRDATQVPPREPCPTFKSFLSDGGKVEDLMVLSLCKRILQRSKRKQLPQPPPSQLEALIPAETCENSKDSGCCVTTDKHITPSMAVIQTKKVASSPPLQNKVFVPEQIPNAVVNDNFSNSRTPVLTFSDAKDKTNANSCSTTLVAAVESLDTTCSKDKPLQMDIPSNTTLFQSTTFLQEDFTVSDKPMEYLTNFQPVVITQQKSQVSLPIVSLEVDKDSIISWTKLEVAYDFDKGTNQVADMINFQFGKIVMVNNSAMTWDLTVSALDAEALQQYISYFNDMYVLDLDEYKWQEIKPKLGMQWPSPRSGFQFSVHLDEVFLYGGYFKDHGSEIDTSEKGVVHADLWMLDPRSWEWSKVKKQGMPPGARAGFSMCTHKRRAILFGGVIDTEAEGEVLHSTFLNEMYAFQMDNRRWYPLELRKGKLPKQKTKGKASIASDHGQLLETGNEKSFDVNHSGETVNKQVSLPSSIDAGCADMDVQSSRCYQNLASQMEETELDDTEMDHENSTEFAERSASMMHIPSTSAAIQQVVKPCGRINGCMVVGRDTLYLYGGLMEVGDQEITLDDLYTLDLDKLDEWRCLIEASKAEWVDLHEEEDADDESDSGSASDTDADSSGDEADGEFQDTKSGTLSAAQETAALLRGAGKKMLRKERKNKIENLRSALGLADLQRTPKPGETLKDFFVRTTEYWQLAAHQHTQHTGKELRKDGFDLAEGRYRELKPVLDELAKLEAEQKEEEEENSNTLISKKAKEKARHANNYR